MNIIVEMDQNWNKIINRYYTNPALQESFLHLMKLFQYHKEEYPEFTFSSHALFMTIASHHPDMMDAIETCLFLYKLSHE